MDPIPELQAHGSGPGYRDVLWVEARSFPSLQYGEQGNKDSPWRDGLGKLNHEAQMLGTGSSSYFSREAMFLRIGKRVRKEREERKRNMSCPW